MKKLIFASILIIILVTVITPLVYSLADYRYYTRVTFTNSTAADVTGRYVASINADGLIDQGFMQADADDARIDYETDAVMKSGTFGELNQTAAYWYSDIITVPAYSSVSRDIWTGNGAATTRDQSWVGDDGDTNTVADDASLDITTNLTLSTDIYIPALPATEKEIISKENAYELCVDNTNFIFRVYEVGNEILRPDSAGDITQLVFTGASNWQSVNEVVADDNVTRVFAGGGAYLEDTYNLGATAIPVGSTINSVTVYYRARDSSGEDDLIKAVLRLGGVETVENPQRTLTTSWTTYSATLARPGGGIWSVADLGTLQAGIYHDQVGLDTMGITQVYVSVAYAAPHESVIAATTGAWKTITGTYNGAQTAITDGTLNDSDAAVITINTNTENVYIGIVDAKIDSTKIGDTNIAAPTWKLNLEFEADEINGVAAATTVTDLSASTNDMSSTRTGNPAGVTTTVSGILPVVSSSVPLVGKEALISDAAKEFNPQAYNISEAGSSLTNAQIPGLIINTASEASGVDTHWVWWFIYGLICICLFLVGMRFLGGHITISWVMVIIVTAMFTAWDVVPWWFIMIYSMFALGSLAWENRTNI